MPALVARLVAAGDRPSNREAAAGALAEIGAPAASEAIPALVQVLEKEAPESLRRGVVRSLGALAVHDSEAIAPLIEALDDPEEGVRYDAAIQLKALGGRAGDALPALRRLLDREHEPEAVRSQAGWAVESIERGELALRLDEPYHSLSNAASRGRFVDASVAGEVRSRLDKDDFEDALTLLDDAIEGDQDSIVWLDLFRGARALELRSQHRYYERYLQTSGLGGFWHELKGVVRSTREVQTGMRRMIRYCSSVDPDPRWKRFYKLDIADDLTKLREWLEVAFTEDPPPDSIPGLWFGLGHVNRAREPSLDMYVSGGYPDDEEPEDRVIGGSWQPRKAYAHSAVLDEIHKIANAEEGGALEQGEYRLALSYGGLAVRWLAMTLDPTLLLGGAPQRVLAVGFDDGDSIGAGTLRHKGLVFPESAAAARQSQLPEC